MRRLLTIAGICMLALSTPLAAQTDEDAIARLNALEIKHRNAPIDAAALADIQSFSVPHAGLVALGDHPSLRTLWVSETAVGDEGMKAIASTNITSIMANKTNVGDQGLLTLAGIATLANISVRDTNVTDAGIEAAMALSGRHEKLSVRK